MLTVAVAVGIFCSVTLAVPSPAQANPADATATEPTNAPSAAAATKPRPAPATAATAPPKSDLLSQSLPLRTALYHDPTLQAPLERLLAMFREQNRLGDLVALYRTHIAGYPNDAGATLVLIRILQITNGTEALQLARQATLQFPRNADVRYTLYALLRSGGDPRALEELEAAIALETKRPSKRRAWLEEIVPAAAKREDRTMAERNLLMLNDLVKDNVDAQIDAARLALSLRFYEHALDLLAAASRNQPSAENGIELEILAATAEAGLDRPADAAQRLDAVLARVTADYWRRPEILKQRMLLVRTEKGREDLLKAAREAVARTPGDEAAVLSLAQLLEGFDRRREAERVLLDASERMPKSAAIENALMGVFDRLQNEAGREAFLAKRLAANPGRSDLALRHVKSLYLLSRRTEARRLLDATLANADARSRAATTLEMARFLRKSSMRQDSMALFEELVRLEPNRFELRRELAELYLAGEQKEQVRALFSQSVPPTLPIEQFLEVLQFMVRQELWTQARDALTARARQDPVSIEVRVLLLQVLAQLGQQEEGLRVLAETRAIADSGARYRMWLEAAAKFHDVFETSPAFLESERVALEGDKIADAQAKSERMQSFLDVYGRSGIGKEQIEEALRSRLAAADDPALKVRLRERLVEILTSQTGSYAAAEEQLTLLQKEDPARQMDYLARLAGLHVRNQRMDLAVKLLPQIDVLQVSQSSLIEALLPLYTQDTSQAPQGPGATGAVGYTLALERLINMDPSNRAHWRQWLLQLASAGEEFKLRAGLQRVLAGVERMPLSDETRQELEGHLRDSYGRSAGKLAADNTPSAWTEALPLLDFIYQGSADRTQRAWALWMRAWLLKKLDQNAARDEAIAELQKLIDGEDGSVATSQHTAAEAFAGAPKTSGTTDTYPGAMGGVRANSLDDLLAGSRDAKSSASGAGNVDRLTGIAFPDGLTLSADAAMALLRDPAPAASAFPAPSPATASAALRLPSDSALNLAWCFDTPSGLPIQASVQADEDVLFVLDSQGNGYGVHSRTGKLLWDQPALVADYPTAAATTGDPRSNLQVVTRYQGGQRFTFRTQVRAGQRQDRLSYVTPATDGRGRVYLPTSSGALCINARSGQVMWEADLFAEPVTVGPSANGQEVPPIPLTQIFCQDDRVWVAAPWRNDVGMFSAGNGKLLWSAKLDGGREVAIPGGSTGSALGPKHLMVYGSATGLMDRQTGATLWTLEPERVRRFPVDMKEPSGRPGGGQDASAAAPHAYSYNSTRAQLNRYNNISAQYSGGMALGSRPGFNFTTDSQGQNVLYMDANPPGTSYIERMPGFQLSILAPAVGWASRTARANERLAAIAAGRLLLMLPGEVLSINLEIPVGARRILNGGTFAGVAGRSAVFTQQNALVLIDVVSGEVTQLPYQQFVAAAAATGKAVPNAKTAAVWPQACVDGVLVYATGPWGIACVNARTAHVLRVQPWPESLAAVPAGGNSFGMASTVTSPSEGYQPRPFLTLTGMQIPNTTGQYAYLVPMISSVQSNLLIASMSPGRIAGFVPPPANALASPDASFRATRVAEIAHIYAAAPHAMPVAAEAAEPRLGGEEPAAARGEVMSGPGASGYRGLGAPLEGDSSPASAPAASPLAPGVPASSGPGEFPEHRDANPQLDAPEASSDRPERGLSPGPATSSTPGAESVPAGMPG